MNKIQFNFTSNNVFINIKKKCSHENKIIISGGSYSGLKGSAKINYLTFFNIGLKLYRNLIKDILTKKNEIFIYVKGVNKFKMALLRGFFKKWKKYLKIKCLVDLTNPPFNGCRAKKIRRKRRKRLRV